MREPSSRWAATLFLWPVLSWAGPAEQFLSEDFFPGFHILEKLEESPIYQVYDRGQRLTDPPQLDWSKAKDLAEAQERLESLLKIPPREEMQLPCAFFTPDGERIEALQGLLRSPVLFFLENGQWMWPAVRIGFQQNVTGLPDVYLTTLSLRPAVFEVRNFMSSQEADEVMAIGAQQGLHSSKGQMQSNDLKKGTSHASFRTSKQAWLSNDLAPIIARLDERTAQVTRIPAEHNEPVQLLRYDTGTYYHAHMDWTELDFYPDQRHIWMDSHFGHFDRLATLFWYLNDVQEGGETIFPKHGQPICAPRSLGGPAARFCTGARDPDMSSCVKGLKVRPRKGTAVLWYNFLATGRGDRNSLHAGCPVGPNETKWSGNKWVRNKPWGTPGHWMPGHPALKRYGWRADDEEPSCHIAFQSHSDQPAALLWLDGKKAMELAKIPPHGSIAQLSYDGHRFQIRVGEHSSRPVSCRAPSSDFVITKSLDLVPITENQEL